MKILLGCCGNRKEFFKLGTINNLGKNFRDLYE